MLALETNSGRIAWVGVSVVDVVAALKVCSGGLQLIRLDEGPLVPNLQWLRKVSIE